MFSFSFLRNNYHCYDGGGGGGVVAVEMGKWCLGLLFSLLPRSHKIRCK
jgi:hypothetical protein